MSVSRKRRGLRPAPPLPILAVACVLLAAAPATGVPARDGQPTSPASEGADASRQRSPRPAPDFSVELLEGDRVVSLDDLAGRWVLVDFWATWCGPCIEAMEELHFVHRQFAGEDFEILGISMDDDPGRVRRFRERRWEMPWWNAVPDGALRSEVARAFGVRGLPSLFLVSPEGDIVARGRELRGERLERTLERFLWAREVSVRPAP